MQIDNSFDVSLPPDEVFELLLDLERVAPCMPGASVGPRRTDGSHELTVKVNLGPMRFKYEGLARIAEQDRSAHRAVLAGEAREARGQGTAQARVTMTVAPGANGSSVTASAEIDLTGRAAQMGHGAIAGVASQLIGDMSRCLEQRFTGEAKAGPAADAAPAAAPAKPVSGLRLGLRALAQSLRRLLSRKRSS
ncbi:MAG: uncharacterized protein QOH58_672 [Thermoleophilaceae bacterium]|jgi:carbon monoxide dehydrogenase subunit G|nr:uncharacterized protein [Thermoleophilaceae bacterium]